MKKLLEADIRSSLSGIVSKHTAERVAEVVADNLLAQYEIKPKMIDISTDLDILMPVSAINSLQPNVGELHVRSCNDGWEYCNGECNKCVKHSAIDASTSTELKYKCVAHCPELDLDGNEHCVLTSVQVVDFYGRYPDGCPCGNTPKWVRTEA